MMQILEGMALIPDHNIQFMRTHPMTVKLLNYLKKHYKRRSHFKWKQWLKVSILLCIL